MKTHVSLQQENVLIRILFAATGSTQSKNKEIKKTQKQTNRKKTLVTLKAAAWKIISDQQQSN